MEVGKEFNIQPYGTEALSTLRIEMGHVAGPEIRWSNHSLRFSFRGS